jgi:transposase-like protein
MEELLSGESRPAQVCRRHNIQSSLLYHWKQQYSRGKFNNEPTEEAALKDRIEQLERVMGFEPTTPCLGSKYSTAELHPLKSYLF